MKFLKTQLAGLLAAAIVFGVIPRAHAEDDNMVSLNFANAEIESVIKAIGKITGRNFLIDPRVRGKLNITTNTPVPRALTFDILLAALRLQGYTAVDSGGVMKIIPEADGKLHSVPVGRDGKNVSGAGLATQVFMLKNESAAQMVPVLRPLISPNNTVTAFPSNNALVVTDYSDNLERIARILESIDVPQGDLQVIELKHAAASDLADTVSQLLGDGSAPATPGARAAGGQQLTVLAENRSNSLLVRADSPAKLSAVRQLVAALDKPGAGGNIHVVYLKNAEATRVAETLRAVLSGSAPSAAVTTKSSGLTASPPMGATSASSGGSASSLTPPATGGGVIQADAMSNALIITAPEAIYRNLRHVIEQLDRRRAQVYVEALIAEITAERAAEWGLQWAAGAGAGSGSSGVGVIGGTAFSSGGNNLNQFVAGINSGSPVLPGNGVNIAIGGGTVSLPGIGRIPSLAVLARFLETDTKANILSAPNLIMLDNEEAKIVVGRNLPFITGQYTNTGGSTTPANPFQTIERRDVGLTLKVKPQISEGGVVRLQIFQEASSVITIDPNTGPVTNTRSLESTVLVDDGSIIALGGLVEDGYTSGEEKVPVLGDLPIAGALFRYDTRKRTKTNLIVFLRPVILRNQDSYGGITQSRYDYIIGKQREILGNDKLLKGEETPPELPPMGSAAPAVPLARAPLPPPRAALPAEKSERVEVEFIEP